MSDGTQTETQPAGGTPPPGGSGGSSLKMLLIAGVAVASILALAAGGAVGAYIYRARHGAGGGVATGHGSKNVKQHKRPWGEPGDEPAQLPRPATPGIPAVVIEVRDAAKVRTALTSNEWLKSALSEPLGRGFVGSFAGFLGTRGEDVDGSFKGTVLEYAASEIVSGPFDVIWFGGRSARSTPAIVLPQDSSAWAALDRVARHGEVIADGCPAKPPKETPAATGSDASAAPTPGVTGEKVSISRWVLAGESLYSSRANGRVSFAKNPTAALYGVCADLPTAKPTVGADLEIAFAPEGVGREAELLSALLGVSEPTLAFAVNGNRLDPVGITSQKASADALDVAALPEKMLEAIPADVPVLATLAMKLPEKLDDTTLATRFKSGPAAGGKTRMVAVLWRPHGDGAPTDVGILWSEHSDESFLADAFGGPNALRHELVCEQDAFFSSNEMIESMRAACAGKSPNMKSASPDVVKRLRAPSSVTVDVALGSLLSGLVSEAYAAEEGKTKSPKEILAAEKRLGELPGVALSGVVKDGALVPGGNS